MTQPVSAVTPRLPDEPISYEDFLAWALRADVAAEWVDGRIVLMSPVSNEHQEIVVFLLTLMNVFVQRHDAGRVFVERMQMRTAPGLPGREPDLLFVAAERDEIIRRTFVDGHADIAIEVLSDESRARDRGEKYYEYEQGGVREYWLIDPDRQVAEFSVLEGGRYRTALAGRNGVFRSSVLAGFWIDLEWLWDRPRLVDAMTALEIA